MGNSSASGIAPRTVEPGPSIHDFDFYIGTWHVHHRRLKERLVGSDEWQEFDGTSTAWTLLDGAGNVDDNVLELPDGPYRAVSLRIVRPVVGDVVDLVARWPQPGHPRPARRRPVQGRGRHVHRRRHPRRPADPRPVPVVGHHRPDLSLGAGLLTRRRNDLGGQLDHGVPAASTRVRAPRSRLEPSRPLRSRQAPPSSPAPRTPVRVSVRRSSRPRRCCWKSTPGPRRRPGRGRSRMRSVATAVVAFTMSVWSHDSRRPGWATSPPPVRARCSGSQGGPSRSRPTAAAWRPADSAGSSWARTGASRP